MYAKRGHTGFGTNCGQIDRKGRIYMQTRLSLKPGQKGTKKLVVQYGDQLVAVRYRYDAARQRRYKTVELIVEESPWSPRIKPVKQ